MAARYVTFIPTALSPVPSHLQPVLIVSPLQHWPFYKLFVADARRARNGRHIDELGWYDPLAHKDGNKHVAFNFNRIKYWLSVGAQPTESVARILSRVGFFPARPTIGTTCNSGSDKNH